MDPKPGYTTTQFYLAAATLAAGVLNRKLGLDIQPAELATVAGMVVAFIAHRHFTYAKASE